MQDSKLNCNWGEERGRGLVHLIYHERYQKSESTCRRRRKFHFARSSSPLLLGERFIPSHIRKRNKPEGKSFNEWSSETSDDIAFSSRHCRLTEINFHQPSHSSRFFLYVHIYIYIFQYRLYVDVSQKSVLMSGTSFIIRTGNGTINPPRFVLHEPTTSDVIGRKNYSLFTKKKKKEKDNCNRNSNSIPISRKDIERV